MQVLAFDSDDAGNIARKDFFNMLKTKSMTGTRSIKIKNLYLDGAKDPDEWLSLFGCESMATRIESVRNRK